MKTAATTRTVPWFSRIRAASIFLVASFSACAPAVDGSEQPYDDEPELELGGFSQAGVTCGRDTDGHGLVAPVAAPVTCLRNADCNLSPKPACAAPADNTCLCNARNALGSCTSGHCQWHTDPRTLSCVCVPGQVQRCTTAAGAPGLQDCSATGSSWGTCT